MAFFNRLHGYKKVISFFLFLSGIISSVFSANVFVPSLELATRMRVINDKFVLGTMGDFGIGVDGGYKFGGSITLGFQSENLETSLSDLTNQNLFRFRSASVFLRDLFPFPLNIRYFVGELEQFCSGDAFPRVFGTASFASRFRGFAYFPDGTRYNGIHGLSGTGIEVSSDLGTDWLMLSSYLYQDSYLGSGRYSADIRSLFSFPLVKIEAFAGASFPESLAGLYRFGFLFYFKAGETGEFLTQIGITQWDPAMDTFGLDLFYILFEPRVHFGLFSIVLNVFLHPAVYMQTETSEGGSFDLHADFLFGNLEKHLITGGLETSVNFKPLQAEQFKVAISPVLSALTSGIFWDLKINFTVFPFTVPGFVEGFIGIRAEF